jgi:hypothetical protein
MAVLMIPPIAVLQDLLAKLRAADWPLEPEDACRLHALGQHEMLSFHGMCAVADHLEYRISEREGQYSDQIFVHNRDLPDRDLTAACALAERVFPGRAYGMRNDGSFWHADIADREVSAESGEKALCAAVLIAAICKLEEEAWQSA